MNPGELSYLQPACREAALLSNDERIHWLRQERWIQYPRAERILERLMDLVDYPPRDRMPCLVVYPSQPFRLSILSDGCLIFRKPCFSGSPFVQGATHGSRHGASDMRSALCASLNNLSYTSGGMVLRLHRSLCDSSNFITALWLPRLWRSRPPQPWLASHHRIRACMPIMRASSRNQNRSSGRSAI